MDKLIIDKYFDSCKYSDYFGDYSMRLCNHPDNKINQCSPNCGKCLFYKSKTINMNEIRIAQIIKGGIYQHYKGSYVEVLDVGRNTETNEDMIIYHHVLYDPPNSINHDVDDKTIWIRPARVWCESINETTPRFKLVWSPNKS